MNIEPRIDDGGPMFPIPDIPVREGWLGQYRPTSEGATLRDFFAASALAGLVQVIRTDSQIAASAYSIADRMIEARKQ